MGNSLPGKIKKKKKKNEEETSAQGGDNPRDSNGTGETEGESSRGGEGSTTHDVKKGSGNFLSRRNSTRETKKEKITLRKRSNSICETREKVTLRKRSNSTCETRKEKVRVKSNITATRECSAEIVPCDGQDDVTQGANSEDGGSPSVAATSSEISYPRTQGQNTMDGAKYEVAILALLFLRLKNSKIVSEFHLATNVDGAGALDDVMVKYKLAGDKIDSWHTCFVQVKHREKALLKAKWFTKAGEDLMTKFLNSYVSIKKRIEFSPEDPLFNGCDMRNCSFVLYTNAQLEEGFRVRINTNSSGVLGTFFKSVWDKGVIFNLSEEEEFDKAIFDCIMKDKKFPDAEETKEFVKNVIICSGQPSVKQMEDIVKQCLVEVTEMGPNDIDQLFRLYIEAISKWWNKGERTLTIDSDLFEKTRTDFEMSKLSSQNEKHFYFKTIKFQEIYILDDKPLQHLCHSLLCAKLCCTRLVKTLQRANSRYILLGLENLLHKTDEVMLDWGSSKKHTLVIVSETTDEHDDLGNKLCQHLEKSNKDNCRKKIVVVSTKNDAFTINLKKSLPGKYNEILDCFETTHLKSKSRHRIENTCVTFQGKDIKLGELLGGEEGLANSALNDVLIKKVVDHAHEPISLLNTPKLQLDVTIPYYIPHTLERRETLNKDIFKSKNLDDVFIVHGVTEQELQDLVPSGENVGKVADYTTDRHRYLVVGSGSSEDIGKVFKTNKTVHELRMFPEEVLRWCLTKGNIEGINKFIRHKDPNQFDFKNLLDPDGRVFLILSEAGMGKSTFLTYLSSETKKANPYILVLRVDLKDHPEELQTLGEDALQFLSSYIGVSKSATENALFLAMMNSGKCVVLLDGFDEVASDCAAKSLSLLTSLLKTNARKIFVTSRQTLKGAYLEKHLSTLKFTLKPLDATHIERLFRWYWTRNESIVKSEHQCNELLRRLMCLIPNDGGREFMGTPLLTMILAEIFEEYIKDQSLLIPSKLDIIQIFEQVIKKKYEIYKSKLKLDNEWIMEGHMKELAENHMYASLNVLLGKDRIRYLHNGDVVKQRNAKIMVSINERECKAGIIVKVVKNTPIFLHRTFAEYFTAIWFFQDFANNRDFLRKYLFTDEFKLIRQLFDLMLAKESDLITAVLMNDLNNVKLLLSERSENVYTRDLGGRSALHLGAVLRTADQYPYLASMSIVPLLLDHDDDWFTVDNVLGWNVLEYAIFTESWRVFEYLNEQFTLLFPGTKTLEAIEELPPGLQESGTNQHERSSGFHIKGNDTLLPTLCAKGKLVAAHKLITCIEDNLTETIQRASIGLRTSLESSRSLELSSENLGRVSSAVAKYINARDHEGSIALHYVATFGFVEVIKLLISKGGDRWALNSKAQTPLHCYIEFLDTCHQSVDGVVALIDSLKEEELVNYINLKDSSGMSPLHYSAKMRNPNTIKLLIAKGGNVWKLNNEGRTPLHVISKSNNCNVNIARAVVESLDENSAKEYITMKDSDGMSSLQYASKAGDAESMQLLISKGGDVWELAESTRQTLLMLNCESEHCNVDAVRTLVESLEGNSAKEYITMKDSDGMSSLQYASKAGDAEAMQLLISMGGDVWELTESTRQTLLMLNCESEHCNVDAVRTLVESLKDEDVVKYVNIRDSKGMSARKLALKSPQKAPVVDFLRKRLEKSTNF